MLKEYDEWYEKHYERDFYPKYHEEPISFDPTYKRDSATNNFYVNKNDQCPSYTDRVLFKNNCEQSEIIHMKYECRDNVFGSDHRPVCLVTNIINKPSHYMNP